MAMVLRTDKLTHYLTFAAFACVHISVTNLSSGTETLIDSEDIHVFDPVPIESSVGASPYFSAAAERGIAL